MESYDLIDDIVIISTREIKICQPVFGHWTRMVKIPIENGQPSTISGERVVA
jgi:hypothetical protein